MSWGEPIIALHPTYIVGLDLGQAADYSALVVAEHNSAQDGLATYDVRSIERLPLRAPYPVQTRHTYDVVRNLAEMRPRPHLHLVVDRTGVGRAAGDLLTDAGAKASRPGLKEALTYLREGDTLVVWRLDRLGRSLNNLIEVIIALDERGIGFKSLTEQIDTTTSSGKLIFHVFGALAEFERDLIRERTQAGLAEARARGRKGGRPQKLADSKKFALACRLYADKSNDVNTICETLGISRATLYRYVRPQIAVREEG